MDQVRKERAVEFAFTRLRLGGFYGNLTDEELKQQIRNDLEEPMADHLNWDLDLVREKVARLEEEMTNLCQRLELSEDLINQNAEASQQANDLQVALNTKITDILQKITDRMEELIKSVKSLQLGRDLHHERLQALEEFKNSLNDIDNIREGLISLEAHKRDIDTALPKMNEATLLLNQKVESYEKGWQLIQALVENVGQKYEHLEGGFNNLWANHKTFATQMEGLDNALEEWKKTANKNFLDIHFRIEKLETLERRMR